MSSEDKVYEWITEKIKTCPGSSSMKRADLKKIYKGPIKEVLDSMAKYVRSTEDAEKVRNYTKQTNMDDLLKRKADAEAMAAKLKAENAELDEQYSKLATKEAALVLCLDNSQKKTTLLQAYADLSENQCKAVEGLGNQAKLLGRKMTPGFSQENEAASSANPGLIFNPNQQKLEPVLKGETRKLLQQISTKTNFDDIYEQLEQMIGKHRGDERWKTITDLQNELTIEAENLSENVNLKRDAELLSKELDDEDCGNDVTRPLQRNIDALTIENAGLMMLRLRQAKEISVLEQQLKDLVSVNPEVENDALEVMRNEQAKKLHLSLAKLISQDRQELNTQTEITKNILQLHNFTQETDVRKNKIVHLLGLIRDAGHLIEQLQTETTERSQDIQSNLECLSQVPELIQSQLSLLAGNPLDSLFKQNYPTVATADLKGHGGIQGESIVDIALDIVNTKAQLGFLQPHTTSSLDTVSASVSTDQREECESMVRQEETLRQHLQDLQQRFAYEQELHSQKLADQLAIWKQNPILDSLLRDESTTVSGMTLAEWVEHIEYANQH